MRQVLRCAPTRPCRAVRRGRRARQRCLRAASPFHRPASRRPAGGSSRIHFSSGLRKSSSEATDMPRTARAAARSVRPSRARERDNRQRGDAEEDDVEPARRRHFEGDQDEAEHQPMPPEHRGILVESRRPAVDCLSRQSQIRRRFSIRISSMYLPSIFAWRSAVPTMRNAW